MSDANEVNSPSFTPLGFRMLQSDFFQRGGGNENQLLYDSSSTQQMPPRFTCHFDNNGIRASGTSYGKAPFTASQLQELERQSIIHKYMMSSMPVPPELLLHSPRIPSHQSNSVDLGFSSVRSDPEPWRCKRTDGKKWRCSRDVAPDQKYCERHAHKNRPRSRKHVEVTPKTSHQVSGISPSRLQMKAESMDKQQNPEESLKGSSERTKSKCFFSWATATETQTSKISPCSSLTLSTPGETNLFHHENTYYVQNQDQNVQLGLENWVNLAPGDP